VLRSRWAYWFGIPVSAAALPVYAVIFVLIGFLKPAVSPSVRALARTVLTPLAVLVIGGALWFVGLQLTTGRLCSICLVTHVLGVVAAVLVLSSAVEGPPLSRKRGDKGSTPVQPTAVNLVFMGIAGLVALVAGQLLHAPASNVSQPLKQGLVVTPGGAEQGRKISIFGGRVEFNANQVPVLGASAAPHPIIAVIDYTCLGCRILHTQLQEAQRQFTNQLAVFLLFAPLDGACNPSVHEVFEGHTNACAYARLALATWRANPDAFKQFEQWIFTPQSPLGLDVAKEYVRGLIGQEALARAADDRWVDEQIRLGTSVYAINYAQLGQHSMPQLIVGTNVTFGSFANLDGLIQHLRAQLNLGLPGTPQKP
jgi:hypothetical protein